MRVNVELKKKRVSYVPGPYLLCLGFMSLKARERGFANFDGSRRAVGLLHALRDAKNEGMYEGGE